MNGEKPPPVIETMTFLMLPNDLLLNCLARVSRLYYPTLSLVSKRFRSLLSSLELYNTRTLLSRTENCLYVCLRFPRDSNRTRWFTLCWRPIQIPGPNPNPNSKPKPTWLTPCFAPYRILKNCTKKKEKKSSENLLVSIPSSDSLYVSSWSLVAAGCNIYKIDGYKSSSRVLFMDCRSHTWHEAPSMGVPRKWPIVNVLDGKIYVAERSRDLDPSNWMECFDPKTKIWEQVPSPSTDLRGSFVYKSLVIEGKLFMFFNRSRCVVYKPKENKWDEVWLMDVPLGWSHDSSCVIDNVLYTCWFGRIEWYDFEKRSWSVLEGLKGLLKLPKSYNRVRLVDYGGKLTMFWGKKKIWCAEIALEKRNKHEIYGKVEWCDIVLTVPRSCSVLNAFAVTV